MNVLNELLKNKDIKKIKICDPCCGSGLFTLTLLDESASRGVDLKYSLENIAHFSDVDSLSVGLALTNIFTYCEKRKINPVEVKLNYEVVDYFKVSKSYDGFITNPPYVKLQNITSSEREFCVSPSCFTTRGKRLLSSFPHAGA